jgi:hypothetical protein
MPRPTLKLDLVERGKGVGGEDAIGFWSESVPVAHTLQVGRWTPLQDHPVSGRSGHRSADVVEEGVVEVGPGGSLPFDHSVEELAGARTHPRQALAQLLSGAEQIRGFRFKGDGPRKLDRAKALGVRAHHAPNLPWQLRQLSRISRVSKKVG